MTDSLLIDTRPTDAVSPTQIRLVLGLLKILEDTGLILTCARCAADGHATLRTGNAPGDDEWKIDCQCRRRRTRETSAVPMPPSGDLLLMVGEVLGPLGLDVRCPTYCCINHTIEIRSTRTGLIGTCRCGGIYQFRKHSPKTKPS